MMSLFAGACGGPGRVLWSGVVSGLTAAKSRVAGPVCGRYRNTTGCSRGAAGHAAAGAVQACFSGRAGA
jgi:hypothetical protein